MRTIKFRVWDKEFKKYQPGDYCLRVESQLVTGKYGEEFPEMEVEQFTGLQDKNGVDIYEGDLIEVCGNKNGDLQVEFKNEYVGGWVLTHDISTAKHISLGATPTQDIEVIGNIHDTKQ